MHERHTLRAAALLIALGGGCQPVVGVCPPDTACEAPAPDPSTPPPDPISARAAAPSAIPATLFGQTIHDAITRSTWPAIRFGTVRLWDTHTQWAEVNPSRGVYDWSLLDEYMALAEQHGVEILYTVGLTPAWA